MRDLAARHKSIALWLSGGADSTLLLNAMLAEAPRFAILRFDDEWTREQKQVTDALIKKHRLGVFAYPARTHLLIGEDENLSLVSYYAVSPERLFPVIRDLVHSDRCGIDLKLELAKDAHSPIEFEAHVLGARGDDRHFAFGERAILESDKWQIDSKTFYFPLFDWTRKEVLAGLKFFGVDYAEPADELNTGNLTACSLCLRPSASGEVNCPKKGETIPTVGWKPKENLQIFRDGLNTL